MEERRIASDTGIVMKHLCKNGMQNLGGRLVLMLMRAGILVGGVVMLAVEMMVVVVGIVSFSEERCLSVTMVKC